MLFNERNFCEEHQINARHGYDLSVTEVQPKNWGPGGKRGKTEGIAMYKMMRFRSSETLSSHATLPKVF